jgi:hypothetical protein
MLLCVPLIVAAACASSEDTALAGGDAADAGGTRDSGGRREGGRSDDGGDGEEDDGGGDGRDDGGSTTDASTNTCPFNTQFESNGETCVGFGGSSECEQAGCGRFGYLCIGGGPPGFAGCSEKSTSAFGNSYCCPKNDCVAQPDQNDACNDAPGGLTKRYQCPPNGASGHVAPPAGCVEHKSGQTALEKMYCCP